MTEALKDFEVILLMQTLIRRIMESPEGREIYSEALQEYSISGSITDERLREIIKDKLILEEDK